MNCSDSFIDIHNHCPNEILPGIVTVQSYNVDELFEIPKETFYTIGIHPWHADIADGIELLASKITEFNPIAIGECGFDKLRGPDAATQERTFVQQVFLSEKLQLPIILHSVKSLDRILAIRIKAECRMPWVLHGFRGNFTTAQMLAKHGIAVSFGRAVITTPQLAEVVVQMPSGTFFLETDDANIPINDMYNYVAELKNMPVDTLKTDICKLFSKLLLRDISDI